VLPLSFSVGVWLCSDFRLALVFVTEDFGAKSLSLDSLFGCVLVFLYLRIQANCRRRVFMRTVVGALIVRAVVIASGIFLAR
jgi:predicted tellurium resistance membrane protein TerC